MDRTNGASGSHVAIEASATVFRLVAANSKVFAIWADPPESLQYSSFTRCGTQLIYTVSLTICVSHYLCLSLSVSLTIYVSHYLCLSLSVSLTIFVSHYLCLSLSVSLTIYVSHYLCLSLSVSLTIYVSHYLCLSLSVLCKRLTKAVAPQSSTWPWLPEAFWLVLDLRVHRWTLEDLPVQAHHQSVCCQCHQHTGSPTNTLAVPPTHCQSHQHTVSAFSTHWQSHQHTVSAINTLSVLSAHQQCHQHTVSVPSILSAINNGG